MNMLSKSAFCGAFLVASIFGGSVTMANDEVSSAIDKAGYALVATFTVKDGQHDTFVAAMKDNVQASRKEPGVIVYQSYAVSDNPLQFVNYEVYKDKAAFEAHLKTTHVVDFGDKSKAFLAKDIDVTFVDSFVSK